MPADEATKAFGPLAVVRIRGFEPDAREDWDSPPGSPLYFLDLHGMQYEDHDPDRPGILGAETVDEGWRFDVLISAVEVDALRGTAAASGYVVESAESLAMPRVFREDDGFVVDVRRRGSGWAVARA